MKCRTLTFIYYIRSIFVSHQSIIPNMTFIPQIIFKILSKITWPRNIGHWPTYNNEVNLWFALIHYPTYDIHPSNTLEDIRQTLFTMKYVTDPQIQVFYEVSLCTILIHYPKYNITTSKSQDIKLNHWTAKNRSLTYIYFMRWIFVSHWCIIPNMTFIHEIILKILSKITRPWNIGK